MAGAGGFGGSLPIGQTSSDGRLQWNGSAWEPSASSKIAQKNANQQPYDASAASAGVVSGANKSAFNDFTNTGVDYRIDNTGAVDYSNASEQGRKTNEQQRGYQLQDRDSFMSLMGGMNAAPAAPNVAPVNSGNIHSNEEDARSAAFARAKDQAGKIARSSLTSIAENMAGRNMSGGGLQSLKEAGAIGGAGDSVNELNRDQLMLDLNRSSDIADQNYSGAITQRGQDITSRGQDLANRASYASLLRSLY